MMHEEEAWEAMGEEEIHLHRHRPRGRGRRMGPPGKWGAWGPGWGPPGPHPFGPWAGGFKSMRVKVRRGDVRAAALALLAEEPRNGYQIISELGERSGGVWRPSPGSVYPALQQLEDEGLIQAETPEGGRRRYALTEEGRAYVAAHPEETRAPWDEVVGSVGGEAIEMRNLIAQVAAAAVQVVQVGHDTQVAQAHQILADTRRALYRVLAAEDDDSDS